MEQHNKIRTFEDLIAWQKAFELATLVYRASTVENFEKDFDLIRQIRRCSVSISSNIAEGYERNGNKEFLNFLTIAKGSCGELRSQLMFAKELGYLNPIKADELIAKSIEVSKIILGLIRYLKNNNQKGYKFLEPKAVYGTL